MPYIKKEYRDRVDETGWPMDPGELNYLIISLCINYLNARGSSYRNINEIIGVLECVKQEFYRRIASPYEDQKMEENGDVC